MNNHFLNTNNYLRGSFFSILESLLHHNYEYLPISGKYRLIKVLKKREDQTYPKTILCKENNGLKVVVKSLSFKFKNLNHEKLINETNILKLFKGRSIETDTYTVKFPKLYATNIGNNNIELIREYVRGKSLKEKSSSIKINALISSIQALREISKRIDKKTYCKLPKKTLCIKLISIPYYLTRILITNKYPEFPYLKTIVTLFKNVPFPMLLKHNLTLSHKDLRSRNIILEGKTVHLLDLEYMTLADKLTDLSIAVRVYYKEVSDNDLMYLINKEISKKDYKRFIFLNLFYTLQILAVGNKGDLRNAKLYLSFFYKKLLPSIFKA